MLGDIFDRGIATCDRRVAANLRVIMVNETHFGHQDDVLASVAQAARQQFFGSIRTIDLGSVEEGDAVVDCHVHGADSFVDIDIAVLGGGPIPKCQTQ